MRYGNVFRVVVPIKTVTFYQIRRWVMALRDSVISALLVIAVIIILILFLLLGWWIGSLLLPMLVFSGWLHIFDIIIKTVVGLVIIGVVIVIVGYIALKLI
jgi:hypothetical protein